MGRSFWEKLGRGVGRGLEKAREVGSAIGERVEKGLDAGDARRRLRHAYESLGQAVADDLLEKGEARIADPEGPVARALEDLRSAREEVARLEASAPADGGEGSAGATAANDAGGLERVSP